MVSLTLLLSRMWCEDKARKVVALSKNADNMKIRKESCMRPQKGLSIYGTRKEGSLGLHNLLGFWGIIKVPTVLV